MKKTIFISLIMLIILSLCACHNTSTPSKEELLRRKVDADVTGVIIVHYDSKSSVVDVSKIESYGDDYTVYGKVTVVDNYGDRYVGKFSGTYKYTNGEFQKIKLNVDTPTRER